MSRQNFIILLSIFLVSVCIRIPNIDRPLSSNYEWVTAHTLVTLQIFDQEGILKHRFSPIYTFPNPNDHHIKCPISGVSDKDGNYYYISYPPFSFIAPHLIFSVLNLNPNVLSIQILNLFLHFICSVLIFSIISISSNESTKNFKIPALIGFCIYVFSPLNLWNHTNVYFADILVQLFFISSLHAYLLVFIKKRESKAYLTYLYISLFLMMYTEWLGFIFSSFLFIGLFSLFKFKEIRNHLVYICILILAVIAIIFFQYSSIGGSEELINTLLSRYKERNGLSGNLVIHNLQAHQLLLTMYLRNYFPFLIILAILVLIILMKRKDFAPIKNQSYNHLLLLSGIPVLLHHFLLFEFTLVHEISLVKSSVFISLCIAFVSSKIFNGSLNNISTAERYIMTLCFVSMLGLSVLFYFTHIIQPSEYYLSRLGKQIKETSSHEEVIFFKTTRTHGDFLIKAPTNFVLAPQIQYYSGRCIQVISDVESAKKHLNTFNKANGIVYTIDNPQFRIDAIERISLEPGK